MFFNDLLRKQTYSQGIFSSIFYLTEAPQVRKLFLLLFFFTLAEHRPRFGHISNESLLHTVNPKFGFAVKSLNNILKLFLSAALIQQFGQSASFQ